jgi:hypothetical protein
MPATATIAMNPVIAPATASSPEGERTRITMASLAAPILRTTTGPGDAVSQPGGQTTLRYKYGSTAPLVPGITLS